MKILITGANGDIAISINKILKKKFSKSIIHGSDININKKGNYYFEKILKVKPAGNYNYLNHLKKLLKLYDLIIPTTEQEIKYISQNIKKLDQQKILIHRSYILTNFLDKYKSFQFLKKYKINETGYCDRFINKSIIKRFPIIIKSRFGAGNKNYIRVKSKSELKKLILPKNRDYIYQEYIKSEKEYTSCIYKYDEFLKVIIFERILDRDKTFSAKVVNNFKIKKALTQFAHLINLKGSINLQFRLKKSKLFIFDINHRLSSTVLMRHLIGFQDCYWWITDFMNKKNSKKKFKKPTNNKIVRDEIIRLYD